MVAIWIIASGVAVLGGWSWKRWRLVRIGGVWVTPSMGWAVIRSLRRQKWIEQRLEAVESLSRNERFGALNDLLSRCSEAEMESAAKVLDLMLAEKWDDRAPASIGQVVAREGDWLVYALAQRLQVAGKGTSLGEDMRQFMVSLLEQRLPHIEAQNHVRTVATALVALDGERGLKAVESRLEFGRPEFGDLLDVLSRGGAVPDERKLLGWLREDEVRRGGEGRTASGDQVRLLVLLLTTRRDEAERCLHEIMALPDFPATMAAEALIDLYDLPHPRGSLMDWGGDDGVASLSGDEATTYLVDRFSYCVGHMLADTLLKDLGDVLPRMHEALERVGAPRGAQLLDKIIQALPPAGLPTEKAVRRDYLNHEGRELEGAILQLMLEHDYQGEDYFLLALRYEVKHRDGFRRV